MIYLTSDTHYNHQNILGYTNRPWANLEEMNKGLIDNYNSVVTKNDTVFFLGDFAMGQKKFHKGFLDQLNGDKILIKGNHDQSTKKMLDMGFKEVYKSYQFEYQGLKIFMAHIPTGNDVYENREYPESLVFKNPPEHDLWLCGHVHCGFKLRGNTLNVGVDVWDYKPVSIKDAISFYFQETRPWNCS